GKWMFIAGALLALFEMLRSGLELFGVPGLASLPPPFESWLAFLSLTFFILSAAVFVYLRGRAYTVDADRYEKYAAEVRALRDRKCPPTAQDFQALLAEMERVAQRELRDFCSDVERSTFIM